MGIISDDELIRATYSHGVRQRLYRAVYEDGSVVHFACLTAREARIYAREFGIRFRGGVRVLNVFLAQ